MFYAIPNLVSAQVSPVAEPWKFRPAIPEDILADKEKYVAWKSLPTTKHCNLSAVEGLTPGLRVNRQNPPTALHGFIADYDTKISDDMVRTVNSRTKSEFLPNWISRTYSGGLRAVWLFESAVPLSHPELSATFLKLARKAINPRALFPGFEDEAWGDLTKYYDVGWDWQALCSDVIPKNVLCQWQYEAGNKVFQSKTTLKAIPLEQVEAEINRQFPGVMKGVPLNEGNHCRRFWDPTADNDRACVIRSNGLQCFTGDKAFMSWGDILGPAFVRRFESDRTGAILSDTWYDGMGYWRPSPTGAGWIDVNKEDFKLVLRVQYGLSGRADPREGSSEIDRVMHQLQTQNRIECAVPLIHHKPGINIHNGQRVLNTSRVRPLEPADKGPEPREWGVDFPWLAEFFDNLFVDRSQEIGFLGWLKHFYTGAIEQRPRSGQAMFIAGPPGVGKTFLSTCIITRLVGGSQDASEFLTGENGNFTDYVLEAPLMTIDDSAPCSSPKAHAHYSAALKKLVANQSFTYSAKFKKSGQVTWQGRVIVTLNEDPESMRMLPTLEINNLDKLILLRTTSRLTVFPENVGSLVAAELPFFARWLLDWEMPAELRGTSRFGVKCVHDPSLLQAALQSETSYAFLELLELFRREEVENLNSTTQGQRALRESPIWRGTASDLLRRLTMSPALEPLSRPYANVRALGMMLSKVANKGPELGVRQGPRGTLQRLWEIALIDVSLFPEALRREFLQRDEATAAPAPAPRANLPKRKVDTSRMDVDATPE